MLVPGYLGRILSSPGGTPAGAAPYTIVVSQIDGLDSVRCELHFHEPDFARLVDTERCWPVSVAIVALGTLQRSWINGKVRDVIELRGPAVP